MKNMRFLIFLAILNILLPIFALAIFSRQEEIRQESPTPQKNTQVVLYKTKDKEKVLIDIEDYIGGVTYAEIPSSFNIEAIKAQAVAARTYTYKNIFGKKHSDGSMCDDPSHCQAYRSPDNSEGFAKIKNAVEQTRGEVVTYNGEFINAVYHSASGGATESAVEVWGGNLTYLTSTKSPGEAGVMSDFTSFKNVTRNNFIKIVKQKKSEYNKKLNVEILGRTKGGDIKKIKIGNVTLTGAEVRGMFGLKSADFTIQIKRDEVIFNVKGYGHGVGLSQYGAEAMARGGKSYDDILKHYYTGARKTVVGD